MNDQKKDPQAFDLLLKNGHVVDPSSGINGILDVGIKDGLIAKVAPDINSQDGGQILDVTGLYVVPGILDIHTHVYPFRPSPKSYVGGLSADAHFLSSGVTTTVDAGTAGWEHFLDFKTGTIDQSRVRILAFLNIARQGMVNAESEQTEADLEPGIAASLVDAYPEILVGIKSAHYWTRDPWDDEHPPWLSVDRALEAGALCGKPVMVDFWPRPPERPYADLILKKLRPGDIHTHVFAQQFGVIKEDGMVAEMMFAAQDRGVLFDLGHGAASFWFRNAVRAVQGGFQPDAISTDLHMANINGPVISMQETMSKMLNMQMSLEDVIWRSTNRAAEMIGRPELGTLRQGAEADVAVFKIQEGDFNFVDCGRARMKGSERLVCQLTVRAGKIVFDPQGLSMPEWQQAPSSYWKLQGS